MLRGHMHNVSITQQVTKCSYCDVCGNMMVEKCEHRSSKSIEYHTSHDNTFQCNNNTFITSSMFETRVDFTSHEYNCPINRTTVYIVLLYRAGFQPRFAYLVKYWDFSDILLFSLASWNSKIYSYGIYICSLVAC